MKPHQRLWTSMIFILEYFIPGESVRIEDRFRALLTIFSLLFGLAVVSANFVTLIFIELRFPLLISNLSFILASVAGLIWIKKGGNVDSVAGIYLLTVATNLTLTVTIVGRSFLTPALYFYLIFIIYSFLLNGRIWGYVVSVYTLASTVFVFWFTSDRGMELPFHFSLGEFVMRIQIIVVLVCISTWICMALHDYFINEADSQLRQEREWLLRSSRLHEVSTLAQTLSFQMNAPNRLFIREFQQLKEAFTPGAELTDEFLAMENRIVANLVQSTEQMILISRSFDWIYRSHKNHMGIEATVLLMLTHLKVLLEGKALENGWNIRFHTDQSEVLLRGAIPSVMLLIVTLVHSCLDQYAAGSDMCLDIEVECVRGRPDVAWKFRWPKTSPKSALTRLGTLQTDLNQAVNEIRQSLIAELLRDCKAKLERSESRENYQLCISGNWAFVPVQ